MELVTGAQMRRIDRRAIEGLGIASLELMEAAGRNVARTLLVDYPDAPRDGVVVVCGKGNNGGDGLVAARHLLQTGLAPRVLLLTTADDLAGDAAHNLRAAREAGVDVHEAPDAAAWDRVRSALDGRSLVLDAILGTGVRGGARGLAATVIEEINRSRCRVVAVDVPSGIDADTAAFDGRAIRAERTYALCRPKLPLVLDPGAAYAGQVSVLPIGIPDEAVRDEQVDMAWIEHTTAATLLPSRGPASHKGDHGHLLAVAGSRGKSGAAVLLARGALRCGVGLVTVATPASTQERVAGQQAEVMTEPLAETGDGGLATAGAGPALELLSSRDALALGPGLGVDAETREAVQSIVAGATAKPLVIDADGLNVLAAGGATAPARRPEPAVLTPHPGEAARLLGSSARDVQADRIGRMHRAVVVLKGRQSLVADPDGRVTVNSTGNAGMASAGTGDVLTGAVGAFLARGASAWDAARLAVYLHGDAGDRAALKIGREGMIASDLIDELPAALAALRP
ncbi:MAG: NAD(P)H-hydrate dehydratase [Planctomycetota bacterium]|jgi:NAD(P)H-hydrate epimerase